MDKIKTNLLKNKFTNVSRFNSFFYNCVKVVIIKKKWEKFQNKKKNQHTFWFAAIQVACFFLMIMGEKNGMKYNYNNRKFGTAQILPLVHLEIHHLQYNQKIEYPMFQNYFRP